MIKHRYSFALRLTTIGLACIATLGTGGIAASTETGKKGAQIYCFMRTNGNEHEVSWNAAYAVIKRQTSGIFKTSPKHAAVMIIETVVQNPSEYKNCGSHLGDLFAKSNTNNDNINNSYDSKTTTKDRYSY